MFLIIKNKKNFFWLIVIFILFILNACSQPAAKINIKQNIMQLSSNDFSNNQLMDLKFTCAGNNISPHLSWSKIPAGTKSFALSCVDPDAPGGDFIHWLVINIPANTTKIKQAGPIPAGAIQLKNDFGQNNYSGPCPPSGTHHYVFKVYALNIDKLEEVNQDNFLAKVSEHVIDSAELIGLYQRQ
jgi:Raf kinase inhibitor-like YbhB/YbcL family protein